MNKKLIETLKYGIVGLSTLALDFVLYLVILELSDNIYLSETLKIPLVLSFNYIAHRKFTFKTKTSKKTELSKYIIANIAIAVIANITIGLTASQFGKIGGKAAQTIIMPLITYLLFKLTVFKQSS